MVGWWLPDGSHHTTTHHPTAIPRRGVVTGRLFTMGVIVAVATVTALARTPQTGVLPGGQAQTQPPIFRL